MPVRLFLLFTLAFTLAILHALPWMARPQRLFGVAVPDSIRYGPEGRRILRRYEWRLLPFTLAALLVWPWLPLSWAVVWAPCAPVAAVIAALWLFSRTRAEARQFAAPPPSTREARLEIADDGARPRMLWFAVPLAVLTATALYLQLHWDRIPARFPNHWGADGQPNGWATRSVGGVYEPLLLGGILVLFLAGISALIEWGSRRSARNPVGRMVLVAVAYIIAVSFSLAGMLPLHIVPPWALLAFHAVALVLLAAMIWFAVRRREKAGESAAEITPDECWRGGVFYYNPQDPAIFVAKRIGIGWTLNFGNRLSWLTLALLLGIPVAVAWLAHVFARG